MPVFRIPLRRLVLAFGVCLGMCFAGGCRYSGPYVESREELKLTYTADPSTSVYKAEAKVGEYRFERFEGGARAVLSGGETWGFAADRQISSRGIAQPFSGKRVVLKQMPGGVVEMDHGDGAKSMLRFVSGSWTDLAKGRDVVMRLEEASWQAWVRATENAVLDLLDGYRKRAFAQLDSDQDMTEARVLDMLVDEKPLVRANRRELMVFFETVRVEGGFEITSRRKDPRYRWWSYELQPEVGEALAGIAQATLAVAIVSLEVCGHCVSHCR